MQLALFEGPQGRLLYDFSSRASNVKFSTNEYGFHLLSFNVKLSFQKRADLQRWKKRAHVRLGTGSKVFYEGRLVELELRNKETFIVAQGYIDAFEDLQVNDYWSVTDTSLFKAMKREQGAFTGGIFVDGPYDFEKVNQSNDNELRIGVKTNISYGNSPIVGGAYGLINKEGSTRKFNTASFTVSGILTNNFIARYVFRGDEFDSGLAGAPFNAVTGSIQNVTLSHADRDYISFDMYRNAANQLYIGEDNAIYARFTNVRIGTTPSISGGRLYHDEILRHTISGLFTLNPSQITLDFTKIQSPSTDLQNVIYDNNTGREVIEDLCSRPDSLNRIWELKIWEDRIVWFYPQKTIFRTWYVNYSDMQLGKNLKKIFNMTRTEYNNSRYENVKKMTDYQTNTKSADTYGIRRQDTITNETINVTRANQIAAASLTDTAEQQTQTSIRTKWIYSLSGKKVSGIWLRSGDQVIIRNIPNALFDQVENTFFIKETNYDHDIREIEIIPQDPIPTLEQLLRKVGN